MRIQINHMIQNTVDRKNIFRLQSKTIMDIIVYKI